MVIRAVVLVCLMFMAFPVGAACNKKNPPPVNLSDNYSKASGKTGEALKSALNSIFKGHKRFNYTPCVWEILNEADEDPTHSNNVIALYTGHSIPKARQDRGGNDNDAWNREHVWAKSHGFKNKTQHAHTDAHHLRANDKSVNSDRRNNDFDNGDTLDNECTQCRKGDGTWEAPDGVKGDIARMMLYMVVRYEGNDRSKTPDLELVNRVLVQWHDINPVSDAEKRRNNVIYTCNSNAFVDHPEYVSLIWNECGQVATNNAKKRLLQQIEKLESELNTLQPTGGGLGIIQTIT